MANDLASLTAAPAAERFGDRDWKLSPLGLMACGEFERWAQERIIAEAASVVASDSLPADTKRMIIREAVQQAARLSFSDDDNGALRSPEGMLRIIWMAVRPNHPDVTLDDLDKIFTLSNQVEMERVVKRILRISGFGVEEDAPAGPKS